VKFKIYGFNSFYHPDDDKKEKYWTLLVSLLPTIDIDISRHDFLSDEDCPIRRNGINIWIMFSCLSL
jgi:hypothetical protein